MPIAIPFASASLEYARDVVTVAAPCSIPSLTEDNKVPKRKRDEKKLNVKIHFRRMQMESLATKIYCEYRDFRNFKIGEID